MASEKPVDEELDEWLAVEKKKQPPKFVAPPTPPTPSRVPCPICKELIQPDALKCRFCGEKLAADSTPTIHPGILKKVEAVNARNGAAAVMSFFIPGLGQLYKGELVWAAILFMAFSFCNAGWILNSATLPEGLQSSSNTIALVAATGAFVVWILSIANAYSSTSG